MATGRLLSLCALLTIGAITSPAWAGDAPQAPDNCYWCTRDAIYQRNELIALLEANPDVDEAVKGPQITAARAEIRALQKTLGPPQWDWATPCCYTRKAINIR